MTASLHEGLGMMLILDGIQAYKNSAVTSTNDDSEFVSNTASFVS